MGSEWLIVGYAVLGFMALYFYNSLKNNESVQDNIKREVDPITFGLQLFCVAVFVLSIIGMGKGIIESYDYCSIQISNSTTAASNVTFFEYSYICFDNPNNQDEMFYKFGFTILYVIAGLFMMGFLYQIFVYVKTVVLPGIKNRLRK